MFTLTFYESIESIILSVNESNEISIKDISYIIAEKFDYSYNLEFDQTKADGQYKKTADNLKLMTLINNFTFIDIKDGINTTIDWFIENYDNCIK